MNDFIVSPALGLAVGVIYGLVPVRSPAPPLIALVGRSGIVPGEGAIDRARHNFRTSAQELSWPASEDVRAPHTPQSASSKPTAIL